MTTNQRLERIEKMLGIWEIESITPEPLTIAYIKQYVCSECGVPVDMIDMKGRKMEIVFPRHLSIYFILQYFPAKSLTTVGYIFGGRDHSTIIHAKNKIDDMISIKDRRRYPIFIKLEKHFEEIYQTVGAVDDTLSEGQGSEL